MTKTDLPPIPIPPRLLYILRDYRELIAEVRDRLDRYLRKPSHSMPLDQALWALQDKVESFLSRARDEVAFAEAGGNAEALARARAKLDVMFSASSNGDGLGDMGCIVEYFDQHENSV